MPPRISIKNIIEAALCPQWSLRTLYYGIPEFKNLLSYLPADFKPGMLAQFMDRVAMGSTDIAGLKPIRDQWEGTLTIKGVSTINDVQLAQELGADGIIVSNHGGRQLDLAAPSTYCLEAITQQFGEKMSIFADSGITNGSELAACLSMGAQCGFLGRAFMYAVSALGNKGGEHLIEILNIQITQVMEQIKCCNVESLPNFRLK